MGLHTKVRYVIDLKSPNRQGQVDEIIQFATRLYDFIFDYIRQNEHASLVLTQKCTAQCQQVSSNKDAIIIILQIGSVLPNKTMPNYQHVCRVEVVGLASVGWVGNVILGQFLYGSENRVGTACAKCRMKREVIHQMSGDILYAWAATEINAHKRTDDFAVLITIQPASHTEGWVDYRWEIGVKLLHYWKKILQKERVF